MLLHLVLDGMWTMTETFWWPAFGADALGAPAPESTRGPVVLVLLEGAGALALVWFVRRFALTDAANRSAFLRTGRLPRDAAREP
jgi:hypothetical protein